MSVDSLRPMPQRERRARYSDLFHPPLPPAGCRQRQPIHSATVCIMCTSKKLKLIFLNLFSDRAEIKMRTCSCVAFYCLGTYEQGGSSRGVVVPSIGCVPMNSVLLLPCTSTCCDASASATAHWPSDRSEVSDLESSRTVTPSFLANGHTPAPTTALLVPPPEARAQAFFCIHGS